MIDKNGNYSDGYDDDSLMGDLQDSEGSMEKSPDDGRIIYGKSPFNETFSENVIEEIGGMHQTFEKPNKPRNPIKAIIAGFGNERVWTVQHWNRRELNAPESLWPSHVWNGLTYPQAIDKKREILNGLDPELNSVEIIVRVNDDA